MSQSSRGPAQGAPTPPNPIKEQLRALTKAKVQRFIAQKEEILTFLASDPDYPLREREQNRRAVLLQICELQKLIHKCTPYIQRLRSFVPEITEPTLQAACYLLLCQALQSLQAVLLLAAEGFHYQMSELLRAEFVRRLIWWCFFCAKARTVRI